MLPFNNILNNKLLSTVKVCVASILLTALFCGIIVFLIPNQVMPGWIELIATAACVACVWLTRKEDNACWPIGIVGTLLIGWTFFEYDLPGQALLNWLYFTPVQVYGWYKWSRTWPNDYDEFGIVDEPYEVVSTLWWGDRYVFVPLFGILTTFILGGLLLNYYGGDTWQRMWDMSIVVSSVIAQWLLNRKRIESWWWWLIPVNISSVVLFWHQEAYLYSFMYMAFGVHAALAIRGWSKKLG